jgi:ribonuclease J
VIYDPLLPVHVSGHANSEEQKQLIRMVKPRFFVPIHGELRMLHAHASLAQQVGIPSEDIAIVENGTILELTAESLTIGDRIPGGYVYVDGMGVGDIGPQVLRERDRLSRDGFVIVNMMIDVDTRELVHMPDITSRGFVYVRDSEQLFLQAREKVVSIVKDNPDNKIGSKVEKSLSDFFYTKIRRRPIVCVLVNEV